MLIVIDGLDGSGKSTQFEIIRKIISEKHNVKAISFPDYDKPSSALVKMYLGGELSQNAEDINAFAASSFYAVDRYASYKLYWEKAYKAGDIILASRYVTSNAIHQMAKLSENQWDGYLEWLYDYEYERLGLPEPDCVIFLDMPVEISQKLLSARYNGDESKKDIHEANVKYLNKCRKTALYAAKCGKWSIVDCGCGDKPFSVEIITDKIMNIVNKYI